MIKIFKQFPDTMKCPVCGTNENKESILIGITGTQEGYNIQAMPVHCECLELQIGFNFPEKGDALIMSMFKDKSGKAEEIADEMERRFDE